jgi:hypothetical protein
VSASDIFAHWDTVPSEAIAPTGMFTDINGNPVELFSQVDVADEPGGGPQFSYISTTWEPGGIIIEFDCNNNGILDSIDIANGTSDDVNQNGIPDECEILELTCDVDANGDIDRTDVRSILMNRNQPASGPDDPMDADGDGQITIRDAKICISQCTNPRCAPSNG